jgi:tetratricopeptide (TPR) repeat protein
MKLYPMIFDLTKDETIFSPNVKMSKQWMLVGYEDSIPYVTENAYSDVAINFPFTYKHDAFPYVGSLDIAGNPVHVERVGDVTKYIKIKKLYNEKKYDYCLDLIDDIVVEYPDSLFMAEFLFYKIKSYFKLKNYDALIDVAKVYLREYSADENIPEVLALVSKAYFIEGFNTDADYFFDRLFSEHADTVYAKWGLIYKGEMYESLGTTAKAKESYRQALKKTKNLDVATSAAFRLANNLVANSKNAEADIYIEKIFKAKPEYFKEMIDESMEMMYNFADTQDYKSAAMIAKALSDQMKKDDDEYEGLLRDRAMWLSQTDKKQDALAALNIYLKNFSDGDYEPEIQTAKDALFFDVTDANFSVKLSNCNKLIEEYYGDSIGDKATYEKAKLLVDNSKFREALDLEKDLDVLSEEEYPNTKDIVTQAAIGTMQQALEKKECASVLEISSIYKIELSDKWDDGVYLCAMKGADFTLAQKMADKNLKSKDLQQRKKWLYRHIKIDFATGNYSNVIEASKELIILIDSNKESPYLDVYRIIFDTYQRLENNDKMISSMIKIEDIYKLDYIDIERYVTMISVGSQTRDNNLVINYAKKVMSIQTRSDSYAQSPFVEFTLYQSYIDIEKYSDALAIIKSLDDIELSNSKRARQKYLLGSVYDRLWQDDNAKEAYKKAIEVDENSAWAKLAQSAMKI